MIPVFSNAASTAGASTGALCTHVVPIVEVDDDGALTIPPRSFPGPDGISGLYVVFFLKMI